MVHPFCKATRSTDCHDEQCRKKVTQLKKREAETIKGKLRLKRKEMQRLWVPGTYGALAMGPKPTFFTVIGWGQVNDSWHVLVTANGTVNTWEWTVMARARRL